MRILVISDTHMPIAASQIPSIVEREAKNSDFCLHCGDYVSYSVFENLSKFVKTYGVCGNMDKEEIKEKLPHKQIIKFDNINLALIHGYGHPDNLFNYIKNEFTDEFTTIDIFVFGHSHNPVNIKKDGKIYFNPGSLMDTITANCCSYGILNIADRSIKSEIVKIG